MNEEKQLGREGILEKPYPLNLFLDINRIAYNGEPLDAENITQDNLEGLLHVLSLLPEREREMVQLRYEKRQTFDSIGLAFGMSVENVKCTIDMAQKRIRSRRNFAYLRHGLQGNTKRLQFGEEMTKEYVATALHKPTFTKADIYVMEHTDREVLKASIEFLKTYREVMWLDNDTGEIVPRSELRRRKVHKQPQPQYPEELNRMGNMFCRMLWDIEDFRISLTLLDEILAPGLLGTMFSPTLIAIFICDSYIRERYCDGLFGSGVENGLYLRMLLRLEDLIHYHEYTRGCSAV